jgi:hypothetical protein
MMLVMETEMEMEVGRWETKRDKSGRWCWKTLMSGARYWQTS